MSDVRYWREVSASAHHGRPKTQSYDEDEELLDVDELDDDPVEEDFDDDPAEELPFPPSEVEVDLEESPDDVESDDVESDDVESDDEEESLPLLDAPLADRLEPERASLR